jgi:hypothetical protein
MTVGYAPQADFWPDVTSGQTVTRKERILLR